jgi:hypothetical protein
VLIAALMVECLEHGSVILVCDLTYLHLDFPCIALIKPRTVPISDRASHIYSPLILPQVPPLFLTLFSFAVLFSLGFPIHIYDDTIFSFLAQL